MNTVSTNSRYGLGLVLSIIVLIACAIYSGTQNATAGSAGAMLLAFLAMACMCCCAERFDGGIPRFYEDLHRADRHS